MMAAALLVSVPATDALAADYDFRSVAQTPPMGWNSWDCFGPFVNETEVLENAQYMNDNLKEYGWEYVVVDIRWYVENEHTYYNLDDPVYCVDDYGRYIPAVNRFPSSANGVGFKALADKIHAMGLKFGIHIMRGMPKVAADQKMPVKGTSLTCDQIASDDSACSWCPQNYKVLTNAGGQAYYNSLFDLYAEWGVDYVKVDDISRPVHEGEIMMIKNAIAQCGRPIVLSLSPGPADINKADFFCQNANMWRMVDDLWDKWSDVYAIFGMADRWSKYAKAGTWPDADMIPIGAIGYNVERTDYRYSRLTNDEEQTLMNLWAISRSPMMYGGNMPKNRDWELSLLTNADLIAANQRGTNQHQVSNDGREIVWASEDPEDGGYFVALFNTGADADWFTTNGALYTTQTIAYTTSGLAEDCDVTLNSNSNVVCIVADGAGDGTNYDHADIINPRFVLSDGTEVDITDADIMYTNVKNAWNNTTVKYGKNINNDSLRVKGKAYTKGFSCHAATLIALKVPTYSDGRKVTGIRALCGMDDSNGGNSASSLKFYFYDFDPQTNDTYDASIAKATSGLCSRTVNTGGVNIQADITGEQQLTLVVSNGGDNFYYDRADWVNPVIVADDGTELSLTTLTPVSYKSDFGNLNINTNVEGQQLNIGGTTYATGLGMNGQAIAVYDLPTDKNWVTFKAFVGLDYSSTTDAPANDPNNATVEFLVFGSSLQLSESIEATIDMDALGIKSGEECTVTDLWTKENLGTYSGKQFHVTLKNHQSALYKVLPKSASGIKKQELTDVESSPRDPNIYNVLGQRLSSEPVSGLYIQGGKKYIASNFR